MRAILTADLHFSRYSNDKVIKDSGLPERLHYLLVVLRQMVSYMRDNKISYMIIAGDVFHNKSIIHSLAMSTFLDFVRENDDIIFYVIDGNHDLSSMSGKGVSALKALETETNVNVIHEATQIENIFMVPWNDKMVELVKSNKCDYLISHFGLNEGTLSSGISIVADIGIRDLTGYKTVLLGHYHKPQQIQSQNTQVYYIGSPIQLDMNEKNEEKRFLDIDFQTGEIKSIPTEGYKKYFQLKIDDQVDSKEILNEAKKLQKEGHQVTIELLADVDIDNKKDGLRIIDKRDVDITNRGITSDMEESSKLRRYCEIKGIKPDEIDQYVSIGNSIIAACSEVVNG